MRTFVLILLCTLSACCSFEKCADKFASSKIQDSVTVDTILFVQSIVPKDSIQFSIQIDSFLLMRPADTIKFQSGRATAEIYKDQNNNYLQGTVECLPDTVTKLIPVNMQLPCPPTTVIGSKPIPKWQQWLHIFTAGFTGVVIIGFILIKVLK